MDLSMYRVVIVCRTVPTLGATLDSLLMTGALRRSAQPRLAGSLGSQGFSQIGTKPHHGTLVFS